MNTEANTFTCACCKGTFVKGWSEAEAKAEYDRNFGGTPIESEPTAIVCDGCYQKLMNHRRNLLG